jgi:hypothetical protein
MKKTTRSSYRQDKYYDKVTAAVDQLLQDRSVLIPVEVFVQMGLLAQADYEAWRFGRIPYLERAIKCNLSKANRILRVLRLVAEDRGLRLSRTVYRKWGKGEKIGLRFSKSGTPAVEELYATHYVAGPEVDGG